jgi:hypothetical protein
MGMRFPVNVTRQTRCPVCKKAGPGTNPPATPRPETATLSFTVHSVAHGRSYPVFLGGERRVIHRSPLTSPAVGQIPSSAGQAAALSL